MSIKSKSQVKHDIDYNKYKAEHDVLALWRRIKQVYCTQAGKLNVSS